MTPDSARQLLAFMDYIERRFPVGADYDPKKPGHAPTGEPYQEITVTKKRTEEEAIKEAREAFDKYAESREGMLYWRVKPEIDHNDEREWGAYMRLLISDKKVR